jgi:Na+-driven multidrug efflux pump
MLKFSVPCFLSLLVSALNNIVDQIFIGNSVLSALGNAATGVVFQYLLYLKHLLGALVMTVLPI